MLKPWYQQNQTEVLQSLGTRLSGLELKEAEERQKQYENVLDTADNNKPWLIFLRQFTDTMVLVLLAATVISGAIGAMADALTIMAIVMINAILGFIQEYRAEKSLEAIKKMASPRAVVIRAGQKQYVAASELVPGDIIWVEAGDKIPADVRFLETFSLEVEESALTGESVPVEKHSQTINQEVPLAERFNLGFMGTSVTRGRGLAVVVETGMRTEMGKIAALIKDAEQVMTPLQRKLDQLGKTLIVICIGVCALVTVLGILRGEPIMTMFMAGISLAVAAIPEGLPAIVTVVLAIGVQRMAAHNAIVRKLPAVETLGCTTVICSDKTGTLTQNKMTVVRVATLKHDLIVTSEGGNQLKGKYLAPNQQELDPLRDNTLKRMMEVARNCNNAQLTKNNGEIEIQGDPTEAALLAMAYKAGLRDSYKRIREVPFDSERKRMTVVVQQGDKYLVLTKGALEQILPLCRKAEGGKNYQQDKTTLLNLQNEWAEKALRVLAFAYREFNWAEAHNLPDQQLEKDLILLGVCGMIDPPREGVTESVRLCRQAGITPIMITGDHPATALAIGRQIGLSEHDQALVGTKIDSLDDRQLYQKTMQSRIFARVTPQNKNRIVKVLQKYGHVVAMTGDGVNDAPAVKAADIGISMGITGTEVTKEASAMILADDDFSTIVKAVYQGRAIYDNIRKFIRYLLGCNIGEVLVMFMASLLAMPLPLLPIQILWVNLVTDGLPAMALGLEPPEPGIMRRKPRPVNEGVFSRGLGWIILSRGVFISVITLISFSVGLVFYKAQGINDLSLARSMALTTLVIAQLFYVFECRSETFTPFELGFFTNRFLIGAVICSLSMHVAVLYIPFFQNIFQTVALNWWQWGIILSMAGVRFIWKYLLYIGKLLVSGN
ncbi:MAG: cation-translocating P-type ATPase [Syntrophomonadaceae bacterium]|nr:cation-translocating P-type ATPase [Syntrophomonadaceae bacterium]